MDPNLEHENLVDMQSVHCVLPKNANKNAFFALRRACAQLYLVPWAVCWVECKLLNALWSPIQGLGSSAVNHDVPLTMLGSVPCT